MPADARYLLGVFYPSSPAEHMAVDTEPFAQNVGRHTKVPREDMIYC